MANLTLSKDFFFFFFNWNILFLFVLIFLSVHSLLICKSLFIPCSYWFAPFIKDVAKVNIPKWTLLLLGHIFFQLFYTLNSSDLHENNGNSEVIMYHLMKVRVQFQFNDISFTNDGDWISSRERERSNQKNGGWQGSEIL